MSPKTQYPTGASEIANDRLWGIAAKLADILEQEGKPVLTAWDLFRHMLILYRDSGKNIPPPQNLFRMGHVLRQHRVIAPDRDYLKHYRVVAVPDLPADDIVCLLDRFCYISHLSAMQRWNLTDRSPHPLIVSRPDDGTVAAMAASIMDRDDAEVSWPHRPERLAASPFRLNNIGHPRLVRQRPIKLHRSRHAGETVRDRSGFARVSTVGKTFLDMLRQPALCGGMDHVLDVWGEHANIHLSAIIDSVDSASSAVKCRAGHILEERLGIRDPRVQAWRRCARRGGSRVLDSTRPYAPVWSETWMISLNA